jgi:DNA modification methylase
MRVETIGNAMLINADCRDWLGSVPACFRVDSVVTDPPYGVGLLGKATKHSINRPDMVYEDSPENFRKVVLPAIALSLNIATCAAIFCGNRVLQE